MANELIKHIPQFISEKGKLLEDAGIDRGKGEIEMILCFVLGCDRLQLYLHGESLLKENHVNQIEKIITRRLTREPLQFILEESWFFGRKFYVSPAVMVPTPETELLCETALGFIKQKEIISPKIIDLGVGSGVIAITLALELKDCSVTALDISAEALEIAKKNSTDLGASGKISFVESDYFANVPDGEKFDLILANPPYISEEEYKELPPEVLADPKVSLTSDHEGLAAIMTILKDAPKYLKPNGRIMFEIGYNQADKVAELTSQNNNYESIVIMKDLNNIDRVIILSCS